MTTSPRISKESLSELLASVTTSEDLAAFEQLVKELETAEETPSSADQPEQPQDRWTVASLAEVAEFFGASVQTVKQWRQESPPMPGKKGSYSVKEIVRWRTEIRKGRQSSTGSSIDTEIKTIKLENEKLDLAIRKKELLDRNDVERWASVALIETREMIMSLPEMLATSSPPEMRDFIRQETDRHCRDVLKMLKRRLESEDVDEEPITEDAAAE